MKELKKLMYLFIALLAVLTMSCTKEGPQGPAGKDGVDGVDGADGSVTCLECHGGDVMDQVRFQFNSSAHNVGAIAVDYAGGRSYCAQCHSHEGFVEWATNGTIADDITAPSAWKCNTCHSLHKTFEVTDYAFRAGGPVTSVSDGTTVFDHGNNNTCMNCHQSRSNGDKYDNATEDKQYTKVFKGADIEAYSNAAVGPNGSITLNPAGDELTVVFDVPTSNVYISSTHAGPHHGPQTNTFAGVGGYTTEDGSVFGPHSDGCVTCHMGEASGHSFKPEDDNCLVCHTSVPTSSMDNTADRIHAVGEALESIHAVHFDGEAWHPMYASLSRENFQAFWNFMIVLEDRSNGAHNPTYVKALLSEAEATLGIN